MLCGEISQNKRRSLRGDPWRPCVIPLEEGTCGKEEVGGNFPLESSWINSVRGKEKLGKEKERKENKEEGKWSEKLYLISKIYRDQAVGFRRSKKQSSSTRPELRVGTRI